MSYKKLAPWLRSVVVDQRFGWGSWRRTPNSDATYEPIAARAHHVFGQQASLAAPTLGGARGDGSRRDVGLVVERGFVRLGRRG